ncbi:MAG: hypothetical protein FJ405_19115 [Verrucomicrobia bacterium]|nr:hypothetical protein [Verrucomicrobiota bacterium]
MRNVDPESGEANAALKPMSFPKAASEDRIIGRLLDLKGQPVVGAIVEVEGVRHGRYSYTSAQGNCDTVAATDDNGVFQLTCKSHLQAVLVTFKPRRLARSKMWLDRGKAYMVSVKSGVTVEGRLMFQNKPVSEVSVSMSTESRSLETHLAGMEAGTDEEGRFRLTQIPPGGRFFVYPMLKDTGSLGANMRPLLVETKEDGSTVALGDLKLEPGLTIKGRVVLSDGKDLPDRTRLRVSPELSFESAQVLVDDDGVFEVAGLAPGPLSLGISMEGYRMSARNPSKDWYNPGSLIGTLDRSLEDFLIHLEPGGRQDPNEIGAPDGGHPRALPLRSAKP